MILIASYPRSGNHLVRFFVEYITGRATLGCFKNPIDVPICREVAMPELAHVTVEDPVGQKAHWVREIKRLRRRADFDKMIFIQREPVDAIFSHCRRPEGMSRLRYMKKLVDQVQDYNGLARLYGRWQGPKLMVSFDALTSDDGTNELRRIIDFIGDAQLTNRSQYALQNFKELREAYGASTRPATKRKFTAREDPSAHRRQADPRDVRLVNMLARRHKVSRAAFN